MKKVILLALLFNLSQVTFAESRPPKEARYRLNRRINRTGIIVVGTAFLINIIRVIKIAK
jgi:hypothetical protein